MATKHPKAPQINQSPLGLRPYVQTKGGYVEKVRRVTDRALEYMAMEYKAFMAQSEFKKPYASPTYDDMEYGAIPTGSTIGPPNKPILYGPPYIRPPTPPGPTPPGPTPGPTPPGPTPPGPDNCSGCWGPIFGYCPGQCTTIPTPNPWCPSDPIVGGTTGYGTISVGAGSASFCADPVVTLASVMFITKKGSVCYAAGYAKDPKECDPCTGVGSIGYTTTQMSVNETQQLTSLCGQRSGGTCIPTWSVSGGGSITSGGLYTAPASNANCTNNPVITLLCGSKVVATLSIAVNAWSEPTASAYYQKGACKEVGSPGQCYCNCGRTDATHGYDTYNCSGVYTGQSTYACQGDFYGCGVPSGDDCDASSCPQTVDARTSTLISLGCCPAALL